MCVDAFGCSAETSDMTVCQVCLAEMIARAWRGAPEPLNEVVLCRTGKSVFVSAKTEFVKRLSRLGYSSSHDSVYISDKLFGWDKLLFLLKTNEKLSKIYLSQEKLNVLALLHIRYKISYDSRRLCEEKIAQKEM